MGAIVAQLPRFRKSPDRSGAKVPFRVWLALSAFPDDWVLQAECRWFLSLSHLLRTQGRPIFMLKALGEPESWNYFLLLGFHHLLGLFCPHRQASTDPVSVHQDQWKLEDHLPVIFWAGSPQWMGSIRGGSLGPGLLREESRKAGSADSLHCFGKFFTQEKWGSCSKGGFLSQGERVT